jgi:hypothetical protein
MRVAETAGGALNSLSARWPAARAQGDSRRGPGRSDGRHHDRLRYRGGRRCRHGLRRCRRPGGSRRGHRYSAARGLVAAAAAGGASFAAWPARRAAVTTTRPCPQRARTHGHLLTCASICPRSARRCFRGAFCPSSASCCGRGGGGASASQSRCRRRSHRRCCCGRAVPRPCRAAWSALRCCASSRSSTCCRRRPWLGRAGVRLLGANQQSATPALTGWGI